MITLLKIKLVNFLSHEDSEIDFGNPQKLLIDGKSGAGKSAISEALIWVLYDKGRNDNRSLIRFGSASAKVILTIEDKNIDKVYQIERMINKLGKHELKIKEKTDKGFALIKESGVRNLQDFLEKKILKSSYLLFINSIAYPQDNTENFVKQTATKRKEILLEIVNAASYEEYYNKAKEKLVELNLSLSENETERRMLLGDNTARTVDEKQIEQRIQAVSRLREQLQISNRNRDEINKSLAIAENLIQELNTKKIELLDIQEKKATRNRQIEVKRKELESLDDSRILVLKNETSDLPILRERLGALQGAEQALALWQREKIKIMARMPISVNYDTQINEINEHIIKVMNSEVLVCPDTKKKCTYFDDRKNQDIAQYTEEINKIKAARLKYIDDLNEYLKVEATLGAEPQVEFEELRKLKELVARKELTEKELASLVSNAEVKKVELSAIIDSLARELLQDTEREKKLMESIINIELKLKDWNTLAGEITRLNSLIRTIEEEVNTNNLFISTAETNKKVIEENNKKIFVLDEKITTTKKNSKNLVLLKEAFGSNGLETIVIDYILPRLEDRINTILEKLSDFRIRLDTQRTSLGGDKTIEGLFISIFNELGEEFDYENYSGGEKIKITVAISEALSEIQNIGFRIIDELFVGLDDEATDKFADVITSLQERLPQLVCITHLKNIKEMFSDRILITKINGVSKINK